MTTNHGVGFSKEIDAVAQYFSKANNDPSLLNEMQKDPIKVLSSMGISVEEQFREAVASQLQAVAKIVSVPLQQKAAEPGITKMSATVNAANAPQEVPQEVLAALEFKAQWWGLVLIVREPAVKYIQGGGAITTAALGGLASIAALSGVGMPLGVLLGIISAAIGILTGEITIMDQGKGVYLTWLYVPFLNFGYIAPYVTPIFSK